MKIRGSIFILILSVWALSLSATEPDVPAYLLNSSASTPPGNQPIRYSLDTSLDQITSDVDREAETNSSPGPFVIYSDSTQPVSGMEDDSLDDGTSSPSAATGVAQGLAGLAIFPNDRRALKKYISILNPSAYGKPNDVGHSNRGIKTYFENEIASNPCLQRRAVDFYSAVGRATQNLSIDSNGLEQNLKTQTNGQLSPGWLWNLAMKSSGGDSGLALELIGMCGQDDKMQGQFQFPDDSDSARAELVYKINRYGTIRADLLRQSQKPTLQSKALLSGIDQEVAELKKAKGRTVINCPTRPSAFFIPESLGVGVDISDSLKKNIERVQNPDKLFDLPSKYYHVYASAFMTCQLIEQGMTPFAAQIVESTAAKLYRGIRLCQALSDQVVGDVPGYPTAEDFLQSTEADQKCSRISFAKANRAVCALVSQAGFYKQEISDPYELRKKIDSLFVTADASYLYHQWFFNGKTIGLPCTDQQLSGPRDLMKTESNANPYDNGFNLQTPAKPSSWTNGRYENAKKKLATWIEDSKWTVAQHEVGASFAAKNCHQRPENETLEQAACRIDAAASKGGHQAASANAVK